MLEGFVVVGREGGSMMRIFLFFVGEAGVCVVEEEEGRGSEL